jgi:flagellar assembly protein FliH
LPQAGSATRSIAGHVERFEYPNGGDASGLPEWSGWGEESAEAAPKPVEASAHDARSAALEARLRAELEARLTDEKRRATEAGREQGRQEGRQMEKDAQAAAQAAADKQRTQQAADLMESFTRERERYLQAVESEVVKLALGVAARILRREAQMDPLLLTGAVRVALGQLAASTQVKLRVPPAEQDLWTEAIALLPNLAVKPTVMAGEGMRLGDCEVETELGSVDLGIRSQLAEIERGFFDRAAGSASIKAKAEALKAEGELEEIRA